MARSSAAVSAHGGYGRHLGKGSPYPLLFATFLLLLAFLLAGAPLRAAASDSSAIPQPSQELYYLDGANILSQDTRSAILSKSQELYGKYGVQLAVITADTLPAGGYTQRVAYLREIMSGWQLGGSQGRALILAVSVTDMDYLAVAGEALKAEFTSQNLKSLLDTQLEPDFQLGLYDSGISKFYSAAADQAEAYCSQHPELFSPVVAASAPADSRGLPTWARVILIAAGALLVFSTVMYLASVFRNRRRYSYRRRVHGSNHIHRHNPVITPPHTTIMLHESHPTVHIKSTRQTTGVYRNQKSSYSRTKTNIDWRQ